MNSTGCAILMKAYLESTPAIHNRSLPALVPVKAHPLTFKSPFHRKNTTFAASPSLHPALSITGSRVKSQLRRYRPVFSRKQSEGRFKPRDNSMTDLSRTIVLMKDHAIDTEIDEFDPQKDREPLVHCYQMIHRSVSKPDLRYLRFREYHTKCE